MRHLINKTLTNIGNFCYNRALLHGLKQNHKREVFFFKMYYHAFNIKLN